MAIAKRAPLPLILMAHDLLEGDVLFRTTTGWSKNPADALVATEDAVADSLEAAGKAAFAQQQVVDPVLVDVAIGADGIPMPRHFREKFRTLGPSVRPDLGKQAEFARS